MKQPNLRLISLAMVGLSTLPAVAAQKPKPNSKQRPNLVYVFADQLRADVLGYAGDKQAITPVIDNFARSSFDLNNAVSVSPVSAPHRASLMTGKYTSSTGMVVNELNLNLNQDFFAEVLTENGYNCGYVGKVHLNDVHSRPYKKGAERFGFDDYWAAYSFNHKSWDSFYHTDDKDGNEVKVSLKGKYGPQEFTTLACDYMERASKEDKPFAMFLSWNPPHDPWERENTHPDNYKKFEGAHFDLPENFKSMPDQYMDRYKSEFFKSKTEWQELFIEGGGYQETLRCYYSLVNSIDEQFGRVLDKLKELGIEDNTIVVFTTDHGEMFGSQGRMFKMIFYEESAHIPLFVRYPAKVKQGGSDVCINTPDIMPTLLGLMDLEKAIPEAVEGDDLSFVLRGEKGTEPEFAFMQGMGHTFQWKSGHEWRSIRDKKYIYARYLKDGKELLFDLKKDPFQIDNLAEDKANEKLVAEYRDKMNKKMEELNDEFKPCAWYRDNWMHERFSIAKSAKGEFVGDIPIMTPQRKK